MYTALVRLVAFNGTLNSSSFYPSGCNFSYTSCESWKKKEKKRKRKKRQCLRTELHRLLFMRGRLHDFNPNGRWIGAKRAQGANRGHYKRSLANLGDFLLLFTQARNRNFVWKRPSKAPGPFPQACHWFTYFLWETFLTPSRYNIVFGSNLWIQITNLTSQLLKYLLLLHFCRGVLVCVVTTLKKKTTKYPIT